MNRSFLAATLAFNALLPAGGIAGEANSRHSELVVEDESSNVLHRTAQIDGIELFYREAGRKEAPTLVLLHGFPTSSHMFRDLIPELAGSYRVIASDYPGFGASSAPSVDEWDYSFDYIAAVVDQLLEKIGANRYTLYVMDYGAPVGFRIAALHPDRVEGLIVQNGNAYDGRPTSESTNRRLSSSGERMT